MLIPALFMNAENVNFNVHKLDQRYSTAGKAHLGSIPYGPLIPTRSNP